MTTRNPRRRFAFATLLAVLLLASLAVTGAAAAPPAAVSGTFTTTSATFNSAHDAGGNTIIDLTSTVAYTGALTGTSVVEGHLLFHPNGTANFHDFETFTGTVNGVPGTLTFNLTGSSDAAGNYQATAVIINGTGGLADLHGVFRQVGTVDRCCGPLGTYSGQVH